MALMQLEKIYEPAEVEARWGQFWIDRKLFHPQSDSSHSPYTIMIPPPNVTGSLHIGNISNSYGVVGLPTRFLVDKQGMVRYRAIGGREFDHPEVEKLIMQLISE
jgi:hypothetical protein